MRNNLRDNLNNAKARFKYLEKRFDRDESLFERVIFMIMYCTVISNKFFLYGEN